jgi:aspartate dehydrogenase
MKYLVMLDGAVALRYLLGRDIDTGKSAMASSLKSPPADQRVAVVGLGPIGKRVVEVLDDGIDGLVLAAVSVREPAKHKNFLAKLKNPPAVLPIDGLAAVADIVIECAPSRLVRSIVEPFVAGGKMAIVLSAGALLEQDDLIELAGQNGGQIVVPTGALLGLDAVTAAAEGNIHSVRMVTRKPVSGLVGAPYLLENNIDIERITEPLKIFDGTAREAAKGFPANLNVAVALSLAGIGPDRTKLEIWADPALTRNTHRIEVEADSARFSMTIENVPSENPKTGRITALSVIAYLRKHRAPLRVGT